MTTERKAFLRRLNDRPRGKKGLNARFGNDPFLLSMCSGLENLFFRLEAHRGQIPETPKQFSMHRHIETETP